MRGAVRSEFIFEKASYPSAHASTLAETASGLVAAWFGGTREGARDVSIWVSRRNNGRWTDAVEVARGVTDGEARHPCWNPVLFRPVDGPLLLFYKVGPTPSRWWGMVTTSQDDGRTWSPPRRLPEGILGPIKNKPIEPAPGLLLCPSSTEHARWRVHMERSPDLGRTWERSGPLNDGREFAAIQPCVLTHEGERMQILCRTRQGVIAECWSEDGGRVWGRMRATALPNPDSGIDAVTLKDGRGLLVYNHATRRRAPLNVAVSGDGRGWRAAAVLEVGAGEYSYPAVIQGADGLVHITYTWDRLRIKYVALDPRELGFSDIHDGLWPE
ncbi:MAG: exo-alpha-sialidase [Alphaproteobacteria bacterium]